MPTAKELTTRYMHANNQRDREALRALLAPVLEFVRPGGGKLTTAEEVMAQYERDWAVLSSSSVEVRELVESGDGIILEVEPLPVAAQRGWQIRLLPIEEAQPEICLGMGRRRLHCRLQRRFGFTQ